MLPWAVHKTNTTIHQNLHPQSNRTQHSQITKWALSRISEFNLAPSSMCTGFRLFNRFRGWPCRKPSDNITSSICHTCKCSLSKPQSKLHEMLGTVSFFMAFTTWLLHFETTRGHFSFCRFPKNAYYITGICICLLGATSIIIPLGSVKQKDCQENHIEVW